MLLYGRYSLRTDTLTFCKGLIWLLIATLAKVPPTVSLFSVVCPSIRLNAMADVAGVHLYEPER